MFNITTTAKNQLFRLALMLMSGALVTATSGAVFMTTKEDTSVRASEIVATQEEVSATALEEEIEFPPEAEDLESISVQSEDVQPYCPANTVITTRDGEMVYVYTVQPGDSLWTIAENFYDTGCYYPYIMSTNDLTSETVQPGQEIVIFTPWNYEDTLQECYGKIIQWEKEKAAKQATVTKLSAVTYSNGDSNMTYAGKYLITGYDAWCAHCCGSTNGITASGKTAVVGRTIAAGDFKMGTTLYIEGYGTYVVEDTGVGSGVIDIAVDSHAAAYALTKSNVSVYIVN